MLFFCAIGVLGRARGDLVMKKLRSPKFRYREDNSPIFYYNGCTVSSDKQCSIIAYIVDSTTTEIFAPKDCSHSSWSDKQFPGALLLKSPGNFSGPKSKVRTLANKPVNFVLLL